MDFEKIYAKLPDSIKYNNYILDFFLKIPKKLQNLNKKSNQLNSQNQLLDLLFTSCDIKIKGNLRNVQLLYIELLRFVDNVCKKHDIDYWLEGGTLIGAVRHGGFIPWDDDIDLSIMRKDYEKLIKVLPEEISKYEYFKENCGLSLLIENQKNYFEGFRSVYDVDDENGFLDDNKFSFLQIAWLKPYVKIDLFPKDYLLEEKLESFKKDYVSTKYKFNQDVKNGKKVFWNEFNVVKKELGLVNTKTKYFADSIDVLQLTSDLIYETDKIFPLKTIKFEGYEFKCPKDIEHTLEVQFGKNFMHIPNVIENHSLVPFIEHQFSSFEEMDKSFSKSISYLKEINNNEFDYIDTAINFNENLKIDFESEKEYFKDTMPNEMDVNRVVTEYAKVLFEKNGKPIKCNTHYYLGSGGEKIVFL